MAVVYQHRRLDTNEVFYIGIGNSERRAYDRKDRNNHWLNVVSKYGFEVDILVSGINKDVASEIEIGMIGAYGRSDLGNGPLVNMTDGGEGMKNVVRTPSWKENISKALRGIKKSSEHIEKLKEARKSIVFTESHRLAISRGNRGKVMSNEAVEKIRESKIGSRNPSARNVIDTSTGVIYGSIKELCDTLGLNYKNIQRRLSGDRINNTPYLYYNKN